MLDGLTDQPPSELAVLAKSWLSPPELVVTGSDFKSSGYDPTQRAFVLERSAAPSRAPLHISVSAKDDAPLLNPAFVVKGWGDATPRLKVNGKLVKWGQDYRYGRVNSLDADKLVVWLRMKATSVTTVEIDPL
jgi:hypothetical protein